MEQLPYKFTDVSIIGAARSGIAAARLLKSNGYNVFLSDSASEKELEKSIIDEVRSLQVEYEFGKHSGNVYKGELMVLSPGVPQDSEVVKTALSRKINVISEIELGYWFCKGKIISITGTNGKTTTTTLTGEIFKDAGLETYVCGNIGTAFCDVVSKISSDGIAVLETSSFQLDNIKKFKPYISVLLNITPDHLDRYNTNYRDYIKSKLKVFENQDSKDFFIYNFDDDTISANLGKNIKAKFIPFSIKHNLTDKFDTCAYLENTRLSFSSDGKKEGIIDRDKLIIKGSHNVYNCLAAISAAKVYGIDSEKIHSTLSSFQGVEHRLEFVRELNGVKYYNDSKATNVNSVCYALEGFDEPIILILGGKDKGNDYSEIEKLVLEHVKHIVAIGSSKMKIFDYFNTLLPVTLAEDMWDAVRKSFDLSKRGDVVLLSPACASFDMYKNFEHRGTEFKKLVNEL